MLKNPHLNMELKQIWFKKLEFNQLVNAVNCNEKEKVFEILFKINERGDLK